MSDPAPPLRIVELTDEDIDAHVGVFRICPKCRLVFRQEAQWRKDTVHSGLEARVKRYTDFDGKHRDATIELELRRHGCGGENYSRGKILTTRLVG